MRPCAASCASRSRASGPVLGGIDNVWIKPGAKVLYLGAAAGTTVSHVSDIVGPAGAVYAVEFSHRPGRDLLTVAKQRTNIIPIIEDARQAYRLIEPLVRKARRWDFVEQAAILGMLDVSQEKSTEQQGERPMRKMIPRLMASAAIGACLAVLSIASASNAWAQAEPVIVNVENFVRAETAAQFDRVVDALADKLPAVAEHLEEARLLSDQAAEVVPLVQLATGRAPCRGRRPAAGGKAQGGPHRLQDLFLVPRLGDEVGGALAHPRHRQLDAAPGPDRFKADARAGGSRKPGQHVKSKLPKFRLPISIGANCRLNDMVNWTALVDGVIENDLCRVSVVQ